MWSKRKRGKGAVYRELAEVVNKHCPNQLTLQNAR